MMLHKIFVYGTLKSDHCNNGVLGFYRSQGIKAVATGIALYGEQGGLPFAVRGEGKTYGEVYEIDAAVLAALDRFEGHPQWYARELTAVELCDRRRVRAWIYLNQDAYLHPKVPDGEWKTL